MSGSEWRQTWEPVAHTPKDPGEGEMAEGNEEKEVAERMGRIENESDR